MPRMSRPTLLMHPEQPVLFVRAHTTTSALPRLVGESYRKLAEYLEETGAMMTDQPFLAYHSEEPDGLEVEIGFPIDRDLPGRDELVCRRVPAQRIACCVYQGDLSQINRTVGELREFILEQGAQPGESVYESLLNGLDMPEQELLAKIAIPVH